MFRNPYFRLVVAAAVLAGCRIAAAHTFCVDNAADLQAALASASTNGTHADEDNVIQVVVGSYGTGAATGNMPFGYNSIAPHSLTVLGGFNANCTARTPNATATVIDGQNQTGAMQLYDPYGDITVADLTFQHGNAALPGAGLSINYCSGIQCPFPEGASASVMHSVIRNNGASNMDCGGLFVYADTLTYVAHNIVAENLTDASFAGAGCVASNTGFTEFYGNTVVSNDSAAGSDATGGIACGGVCQIYDNIFWGNSGNGLWLGDSGAVLLFNDFALRGGATPSVEIGDVSENPHFVDLVGGNYHLTGASPLIGLSNVLLDGADLQGNPYPTGGYQDLGALEETIFFDGGFEAQ